MSSPLRIRDIFNLWLEVKQHKTSTVILKVTQFVENRLQRVLFNTEVQKLNFTLLKFNRNWTKHSRMRSRFEAEMSDWLDSEIFNKEVCVVSSFYFIFILSISRIQLNRILLALGSKYKLR